MRRGSVPTIALTLVAAVMALCVSALPVAAEPAATADRALGDVIPAPVEVRPDPGTAFRLAPSTLIRTQPGSAEARQVGEYLAGVLRPATGYPMPVVPAQGSPKGISLLLGDAGDRLGGEGYRMDVTARGVAIRANAPAGLFAGVQTLRQLLPAQIEAGTRQAAEWTVPGGSIVDYPRFAYRGAMLDIARHFHTPDEIKTYIDELARFKINYLHLHLADDQGWRIQVDSWPKLATVGGGPGTGVDGVGPGYLTKADYTDLITYAAARYITIVPEIDMPGHTNAALSTYAELNCDGVAPPPRTDIAVGYSSLCVGKEITYTFVEDVLSELAELTPGPFLHIGGDEAHVTTDEDYRKFFDRVMPMVAEYGKRPFGWNEITKADPPVPAVPQYWGTSRQDAGLAEAAARGHQIVMSPANRVYLDMKYDPSTRLGLSWAGYIEVADAYNWDPGTHVTGVGEESVLGVEAPLWSETLRSLDDIEYMAFPRVTAVAELGWSPRATHDWESFRERVAQQGPRWALRDVDFYHSPQIPWPAGS